MGKVLYLVAIVLVVIWVIGYIGLQVGGYLIHMLLVVALIALGLRFITGSKPA
jgi:hypothetical protein